MLPQLGAGCLEYVRKIDTTQIHNEFQQQYDTSRVVKLSFLCIPTYRELPQTAWNSRPNPPTDAYPSAPRGTTTYGRTVLGLAVRIPMSTQLAGEGIPPADRRETVDTQHTPVCNDAPEVGRGLVSRGPAVTRPRYARREATLQMLF